MTLIALGSVGCKREKQSRVPDIEKQRMERMQRESAVVSEILESDDSTFRNKFGFVWKGPDQPGKKPGPQLAYIKDSVSNPIYVAIDDKYFPTPFGDSGLLDVALSKHGATKGHIDKFLSNRDTSRFELAITGRHRYVMSRKEDYRKPHMSLEDLPRKYVGNFCRIKISRPTFDDSNSASLTYYENECGKDGSIFFSKLENGRWKIGERVPVVVMGRGIP